MADRPHGSPRRGGPPPAGERVVHPTRVTPAPRPVRPEPPEAPRQVIAGTVLRGRRPFHDSGVRRRVAAAILLSTLSTALALFLLPPERGEPRGLSAAPTRAAVSADPAPTATPRPGPGPAPTPAPAPNTPPGPAPTARTAPPGEGPARGSAAVGGAAPTGTARAESGGRPSDAPTPEDGPAPAASASGPPGGGPADRAAARPLPPPPPPLPPLPLPLPPGPVPPSAPAPPPLSVAVVSPWNAAVEADHRRARRAHGSRHEPGTRREHGRRWRWRDGRSSWHDDRVRGRHRHHGPGGWG
ncbi:hypothetical protein LRS74_27350 [Streptomyces sp. LX-29]|uniref:hypothetical protein n=1 Tax=Streptomyces sp. LX-29 TaxID=2900152 RepID=UPI00240E534F|nr:hypothetical protein [Streptomyces sp. LX-29]WFB10339.1 hypothetical protein LRS74_27350 [Streptomyces sp. LX-29]